MSSLSVVAHNFLGLVELDHAGTVLYSRPDAVAGEREPRDICGSNYYTDVAPFANVEEFRQRLTRFAETENPAESFMFECRCHDGTVVPVRVLLARMRQRADGTRSESVLVHIRKV